jgi:hypothetical protein
MTKNARHKKIHQTQPPVVLGWREWVSLPALGIREIKAKIDTGARSSALHAFNIDKFRQRGKDKVQFDLHPIQHNDATIVKCVAELIDVRFVTDSGAHRELRYVIETPIILGGLQYPIEITLTNRSQMTFRLLLGRKALQHHYIIDPSRSFRTSY